MQGGGLLPQMLRKLSAGPRRHQRWAFPTATAPQCHCRSHVILTEARLEQLVEAEVTTLALQQVRPMTVQNILNFSENVSELRGLLQEELPIRYAHRIKMLELLPDWRNKRSIIHVRQMYMKSFKEIRMHDEESKGLPKLLWAMQKRHTHTNLVMSGIREYVHSGEIRREEINEWLDRFFAHRVCTNMMISHYLQLTKKVEYSDGVDGLLDPYQSSINPVCHPYRIAKHAADVIGKLCNHWYGCAPDIHVIDAGAQPFPFVPKYLFYILSELLKNAVRATVEYRASLEETGNLPAVQVLVCSDNNVTSIRVSDEGGGIPIEHLKHIWSYLYTTAVPVEFPITRESVDAPTDLRRLDMSVLPTHSHSLAEGDEEQEHDVLMRSPLAGLGCGLPLSRLYAHYLGGDIKLYTMPKFGTDVFVYLNGLEDSNESLPAL